MSPAPIKGKVGAAGTIVFPFILELTGTFTVCAALLDYGFYRRTV